MLSSETFKNIVELFSRGENVTQALLSQKKPIDFDTIELIYDLQAGTYTTYAIENEDFYSSFIAEVSGHLEPFLANQNSVIHWIN